VPLWASPPSANAAAGSVKGRHSHFPTFGGAGIMPGSRERDMPNMLQERQLPMGSIGSALSSLSPLSSDHPSSHTHREMALINELRLQKEENAQVTPSPPLPSPPLPAFRLSSCMMILF